MIMVVGVVGDDEVMESFGAFVVVVVMGFFLNKNLWKKDIVDWDVVDVILLLLLLLLLYCCSCSCCGKYCSSLRCCWLVIVVGGEGCCERDDDDDDDDGPSGKR